MKKIKTSRIWRIAYPIIIGNIAQNLLIFTDTAFIGRLDALSLGAAALGNVFYLSVMMLGMGFGNGIQVIVARRFAEGRSEAIGRVLRHSLLFLVPFALLLFAAVHIAGRDMLAWLISSPDVLAATDDFLEMRMCGLLFAFIVYVGQAFFVGIARTKIISVITIVMVLVNIVFDWLLIFGHAGFPAMGIRGAALACVIAEIVAAVIYFVYLRWRKTFVGYAIFGHIRCTWAEMWQVTKVSVPSSLQNFLSVGSWFIFFVMVEKLGQNALAVSNVGRSLYALYQMPVWGFAAAVSSLVSYSVGCRKPMLVYPILAKVVVMMLAAVVALEGLSFVFADFVTAVYTDIPEIRELTFQIMPTLSLSAALFGLGFVVLSAVTGTGNTQIALMMEFLASCLYVAITILGVNVWGWNIVAIWLVDGIYGLFMLAASLIYLQMGNWTKRKV